MTEDKEELVTYSEEIEASYREQAKSKAPPGFEFVTFTLVRLDLSEKCFATSVTGSDPKNMGTGVTETIRVFWSNNPSDVGSGLSFYELCTGILCYPDTKLEAALVFKQGDKLMFQLDGGRLRDHLKNGGADAVVSVLEEQVVGSATSGSIH